MLGTGVFPPGSLKNKITGRPLYTVGDSSPHSGELAGLSATVQSEKSTGWCSLKTAEELIGIHGDLRSLSAGREIHGRQDSQKTRLARKFGWTVLVNGVKKRLIQYSGEIHGSVALAH
jgi:hypothetical protein